MKDCLWLNIAAPLYIRVPSVPRSLHDRDAQRTESSDPSVALEFWLVHICMIYIAISLVFPPFFSLVIEFME